MTHDAGAALDVRGVSKTYSGKVRALVGVDMQVGRGEVFGLLGPNGAGKSTLVKILTTVIRPSTAGGHLLGKPIGHKPTLARVGYLPEHHRFPEYLSGSQVVEFFGALSGVPRRERKVRTAELLEFVGMTAWGSQRVSKYSKGMRQRVGIAQALVNDPDLVILDEPTDGVDPVGRRDVRRIVQALKNRGKTVFINSHLLSELEMVCDRVAILVKGVVARQGTLDELTTGRHRYDIEVEEVAGRGGLAELAGIADPIPTGEGVEVDGWTLRVPTLEAERVQVVIDRCRRAGLVIRSVKPFRPSLEDLFMEAVTDPTTGAVLTPGAERDNGGKGGAA